MGLTYSERSERRILSTTSADNPIAANRPGDLYRDSASHVSAWKRALSSAEIGRIYDRTHTLAATFYSESDW